MACMIDVRRHLVFAFEAAPTATRTMASRSDEEVHKHLLEAMRSKRHSQTQVVEVILSAGVERVNQPQYIDANKDLVYAVHTITAM